MATEDALLKGKQRQQLEQLLSAGASDCAFPAASGFSAAVFNSGGLTIHGAASALAKTASTIYGRIGATFFSKAAADMAALAGTVTNGKFNVYAFFVDAAGTLTSAMGTEGAALVNVVFPAIPAGKALVGFVIINPTGTGNFVGGTTALDDGTVVPNAAYVNAVGHFYPPQ